MQKYLIFINLYITWRKGKWFSSLSIHVYLKMAANGVLKNNLGSVEDVIHGVNRRMCDIRRIIRIITKLELIVNNVTLKFRFLIGV